MTMEIETEKYVLSSELRGHEDDVRCVCICGAAGIATSSRDRTIRFWAPDPKNKNRFLESKTLIGHTSFVGPLAYIKPNEKFVQGGLVSGGMDTNVITWDLEKGVLVEKLSGHGMQVTGVLVDDDGSIVSTSMDCTIRRWRKGNTAEFWEAHKIAVQAVVKLPSGELVTGSSDQTIKLWRGKTCLHTLTGHTDTVRGLAVMPEFGILSASHDCSVRLWAITGQILLEMVGHTSLVYSVDAHSSGLIASGSEDCSLKIWRDGTCIQSIDHPGCVWDAKFMENGDIVTACSDGVVRIWTSNKNRFAESNELEAYAAELSAFKISRKKVGGLSLSELPGLEALQKPGSSNGQTLIIREGDNGMAYSWNANEYKWDKIGEVVDGPDNNTSKPTYNGVQYDYVFDVDIGDGEPIRKLPYNRKDNPYDTADKWLLNENLPVAYRQQVVDFILQSSGQKDFTLDTSFRDPYTGSSAYIPGGSGLSASLGAASKPCFNHIPKKGMLLFESAQFDGIVKKINDFNKELLSDPEQNGLSLTAAELSRLSAITNVLKDTSYYHSSKFADVDMALLLKILQSWPVRMMFPVIDILRMAILHPDGANLLGKHIDAGNDIVVKIFKKATVPPVQAANILTIIRAITNLFKHSHFYKWLHLHCSEILDAISSCKPSFTKSVYLAYSTLVLNYAVLLIHKKDKEGQSQVLMAALDIAEDTNQDSDTRFRALVAVGSLMLDGSVKSIAVDFEVGKIAKEAKISKDAKIAEVGADIEVIIKSS